MLYAAMPLPWLHLSDDLVGISHHSYNSQCSWEISKPSGEHSMCSEHMSLGPERSLVLAESLSYDRPGGYQDIRNIYDLRFRKRRFYIRPIFFNAYPPCLSQFLTTICALSVSILGLIKLSCCSPPAIILFRLIDLCGQLTITGPSCVQVQRVRHGGNYSPLITSNELITKSSDCRKITTDQKQDIL